MTERTRDCVYITAIIASVWFFTMISPTPYFVGVVMILCAPIGVCLGHWMRNRRCNP